MIIDNPAQRLLAVLAAGRSKPANSDCRAVRRELLHSQDDVVMIGRLGKLLELPSASVEIMREHHPDDVNQCLAWASAVGTAFMVQNMHGEWDTFSKHLKDDTYLHLKGTSKILQLHSAAKPISGNGLEQVRATIQATYDELLAGIDGVPDNVRLDLVWRVRNVLTAIDEYWLRGPAGIVKTIESTLGHAYLNESYWHSSGIMRSAIVPWTSLPRQRIR